MADHLFIGESVTDFPGDGTFAGFQCEPGQVMPDDENWQAFAASQPDVAARCFDDPSTADVPNGSVAAQVQE